MYYDYNELAYRLQSRLQSAILGNYAIHSRLTPFSGELATLIRESFDSKQEAEQLGNSGVPEPFNGSNDELDDFISKYTTLPSSPIRSSTSDPPVSPSPSPSPSTSTTRRKKNSRPTKLELAIDPVELVVDNGLTGLQRFHCNYCLKGFSNRADCKRHLTTHSELGLGYECRGCGGIFKRADVRLKHWRTVPVCLDKDKKLTKNREWSRRHGRRVGKGQI